jgi:photosystem II stability/assembly factor-like uncharacterized protein
MLRMICRLLVLLVLPLSGFGQDVWLLQRPNFPSHVSVSALCAPNSKVCWATGTIIPANTKPYQGYSRTTNGGDIWGEEWVCDSILGAEDGYLSEIEALDADTAYAAVYVLSSSDAKGVYKTTDGGATWTKQNAYASALYGAGYIHFFDADIGVVVGDPNLETYTTTNGGRNWDPVAMPPTLAEEYTWTGGNSFAAAGNCVWFVSTKRIFRSTDRGHTWSASALIDAYGAIAFQDSQTGMCVLYPNRYRKTTDGGATWNVLTDPVIDSIDASCIRYVPGTPGTYVVAGGFSSMHCGVACTYDGGEHWTLVDTSNIGTIAFPSDSIGWGNPAAPDNAVYTYVGPRLITSVERGTVAPGSFLLAQNYPNPFNPVTTITYELPGSSDVRLSVFDVLGREVSVLVDERMEAGAHVIRFDGSTFASGVYLYRLQARPLDFPLLVSASGRDSESGTATGRDSRSGAGNFVQTKRLVLLR